MSRPQLSEGFWIAHDRAAREHRRHRLIELGVGAAALLAGLAWWLA
jgi:hypothetical protein